MNGFLSPVADRAAVCEGQLRAYAQFLKGRNGERYAHRERWLQTADAATVRHTESIRSDDFARAFVKFDARLQLTPAAMALLSFVKVNAAEAYGVEVLGRARLRETSSVFDAVEQEIVGEEQYHTRILLGATHQFDVAPPTSAFRPTLPLRLLIGALVHVPKNSFHPVLLGAEIAGVYAFQWMLKAVRRVFSTESQLAETMEARLTEILIDEVGHIAFNRLHVGPTGLKVAASIASHICASTTARMPEMRALGFDAEAVRGLSAFDLPQLPAEIRARAFFV